MASLIVSAAGAYLGNTFLPGSFMGMSGGQWGWFAGSLLTSFMTDKPKIEGQKLSDLKVQVSSYGNMLPILYGTNRISGNVIFSTDKIPHEHESGGGKGGGVESSYYTYTVSFAVALCEGEISGIRRIWANGKLVVDKSDDKSYIAPGLGRVTVYNGTADQMPSPMMEAELGAGNVPAYRGTAYVTFEDYDLGNGGIFPNLSFEVVNQGEESLLPVITMTGNQGYTLAKNQTNPVERLGYKTVASGSDYFTHVGIIDITTGDLRAEIFTIQDTGLISDGIYIESMLDTFGMPYEVKKLFLVEGAYVNSKLHMHDGETGQRMGTYNIGASYYGFINYDAVTQFLYLSRLFLAPGNHDIKVIDPQLVGGPITPLLSTLKGLPTNVSGIVTQSEVTIDSKPYLLVYKTGPATTAAYFALFDFSMGLEVEVTPTLEWTEASTTLLNTSVVYDKKRERYCYFYSNNGLTQYKVAVLDSDLNITTYGPFALPTGTQLWFGNSAYVQEIDTFLLPLVFGLTPTSKYALVDPVTFQFIDTSASYTIYGTYTYWSPYFKFNLEALNNGYFLSADASGISLIPFDYYMTESGIPLDQIVEDICLRAGLQSSDIDVSSLTDIVSGFSISQVNSARSAIESLQAPFFFDGVET